MTEGRNEINQNKVLSELSGAVCSDHIKTISNLLNELEGVSLEVDKEIDYLGRVLFKGEKCGNVEDNSNSEIRKPVIDRLGDLLGSWEDIKSKLDEIKRLL